MKKTNAILMLTAVFVVIFATACGTSATPTAAPVAAQPATLVFPDTVASETYCVQKAPYQNILLDQGATFESLDPKGELQCNDSGTDVDGKNVITCTGKQLWTYELKITTAQGSGTMKVNIGACPIK
ncbi:MAG: hypothetical protein U0Z26_09325 [Anaerolineales bacterium]